MEFPTDHEEETRIYSTKTVKFLSRGGTLLHLLWKDSLGENMEDLCVAGAIRDRKMALTRFSQPGSANLSRWLKNCVCVSVFVCVYMREYTRFLRKRVYAFIGYSRGHTLKKGEELELTLTCTVMGKEQYVCREQSKFMRLFVKTAFLDLQSASGWEWEENLMMTVKILKILAQWFGKCEEERNRGGVATLRTKIITISLQRIKYLTFSLS